MKYRKILLILAIATLSLTACKKEENPTPEVTAVEETVTAITREQFMTLYENANSIYAVSPELFTEDTDISIIDLPEISDTDIPISEAITLNEAIQILQEDNIPRELLEEIAESKGIITADTRWDEALTKTEAVELLVSVYMDEDGVPEFNSKQGLAKSESDKAMNPDYNNPEEYAAEDYYDTEETAAESSDGSGLSYNVDILEMTAEGYKKDLEAGRITQETYDVLMGFLEEAEALADENGDFSLDEVYESVDAKNESTTSTSSSSGSYESTPEADAWLAEHGTKGVEGGEGTPGSLDGYHDPDFAGYRMN